MAGPHLPDHGVGADGPPRTDPHPSAPIPQAHIFPDPYRTGPIPGAPRRRNRLILAGFVLATALVVGLAATLVYLVRGATPEGAISEGQARTAIQNYLDALSNRDIETIGRNTLCGIYDAVREKASDDAVAKLNSDAFRKQFAEAEVTSIDKMVFLSNYQAQALFTMRVVPAAGGAPRDKVQGVAQLLATDHRVLVCSYVQHASGLY